MKEVIDIFDDEVVDPSSLSGVNADTGKTLSDLVKDLRDKNEQIIQCEEYLKQLKAEKQRIATEQIPMLMDEMGIERVDVDGATVQLKPLYLRLSLLTAGRKPLHGSVNTVWMTL